MTLIELMTALDKLVAEGKMTPVARADAIAKFNLKGGDSGSILRPNPVVKEKNTTLGPDLSVPPPNVMVTNWSSASPEELMAAARNRSGTESSETQAAALEEIEKRAALQDATFLESLTLPGGSERLAKSVLKGPSQMISGITEGLPGLALMGIAGVTGSETAKVASEELFEQARETGQRINDNFGVSDALTPAESLAENFLTALVPGGIGVKAAAMTTDFAVDQTVRELIDTSADEYGTVFDRMGWKDGDTPSLPLWAAIPTAAVGGILAGNVINKMRGAVLVKPPVLKKIKDTDKFAPDDLFSTETVMDAWNAYIVDEQSALTTIVKKAGLPNPEEIAKRITLDTHAAAATRAREAVNTGIASFGGKTYQVPVSVKTLYDSAMKLPETVRLQVERYINLSDMLEDANIALTKLTAPKATAAPGQIAQLQGTISSHLQELARLRRTVPIAQQFHQLYQGATRGIRDLFDGDILDTATKQWLDTHRPNYVPLDISAVDKNADFLTRMTQAQTQGEISPSDWFLQTRNSTGSYNIDVRGNPFSILADYTESAMKLVMNNDARLAIIDDLLSSAYGKDTIRAVKDSDDLAANANRIVEVYRGGKKEQYLTSQLTAQLMKFDPFVAKHPLFFVPKRVFEQTATGPLSLVFAPITAIRDSLAGYVMGPKGLSVGNPLQVAAAVPKQLWAKAQKAIADQITSDVISGTMTIPENLIPKATQVAWANKLSNNYLNSIYHLANEAGGFDASLMRNNIVTAQTMMGELSRSIREGSFMNSPAMQSRIARIGVGTVVGGLKGFVALFDAVQDAPRFAALAKTAKKGATIEDAAILARRLTGDTTRKGRAFSPEGLLMGVDAGKGSFGTVMNKAVAFGSNFIQEAAPYVNPMIQGTKQLITSFKDDPVGTYSRAWLSVGLPAFAAYGWNEMAGEEYNEYAMSRRAARDVAMSLYIAQPGLPPEQGIEIPLPHEFLLFNSPFTRFLHGLTEGEDAEEMRFTMSKLGMEILNNSTMVGAPVLANNAAALMGQSQLSGFLGTGGSYEVRDDFSGAIPQNIENLIRTQFSSLGNLAMQLTYAMTEEADDDDWNNFTKTITRDVISRAPIVKSRNKTANTAFSLPVAYDRAKVEALDEFWTYWDQYHNRDKMTEAEGVVASRSSTFPDTKGMATEGEDVPPVEIGQGQIERPTNPLYEMVGEEIVANARRNGIGIGGIEARISDISSKVAMIRRYNEGDKAGLEEWNTSLQGAQDDTDAGAMKTLLEKWNIDVEDYSDRVRLINLLENEKSYLITEKMEVYGAVERSITQQLIDAGLVKPGEKFYLHEHLRPFDDNPLGIKDALSAEEPSLATP